jgi:hypothetical protein
VGQVISIQNATIFQRDKMVLKDVNLSLSENEIVYIKREMILDSPSIKCIAEKEQLKEDYFDSLAAI